jgi:hypothetical protein
MLTEPENRPDQSALLASLCLYLKDKFGCRTAILYGSRARGDWDAASDIDVLAFAEGGEAGHVAHRWGDLFLDLFVYPPGTAPDDAWLRLHGGRVLFQHDAEGEATLAAVAAIYDAGPAPIDAAEAQTQRLWLEKMLARAEKGDPEGDYRRHWLLKDMLEIYFALRGKWYLGPKRSLALIEREAPAHYEAFCKALKPTASLADIKAALAIVKGD